MTTAENNSDTEEKQTVRLELSWTEPVSRTTIVEVEVTEDELEDIKSGYGSTDERWVKEVQERHPGAEVSQNEMDHIELLEPEDTEGTKLVTVSWYHTEEFQRVFRVSEDFDMEDDEQHEELMEQIANLEQPELTEAFEGCTAREITEVNDVDE